MDRYDLAAQSANDGLWDWDLVTGRMHFSARWKAILGLAQEDLNNTSDAWFKRIQAEDLDQVTREIDRCLADGSSQFEVQHRMLHKDGSCRWMSCRGVITRNNAGEAIRIAGSHLDITAEKIADSLTGLPNRFLILNRLARTIETAQNRSDFLFAVIILDVGSPDGVRPDPLIIAAARRLEICLRNKYAEGNPGRDYVVARSGGDEFIILAEGLNGLDEARTIAGLLIKELSTPFQLKDGEVYVSPSIGIALSATGYNNAGTILRDADTARYRAKSMGKGRCEIFDTAVLDAARNSIKMETDLKWALERQEFSLVYQPIVQLNSLDIAGFEALLRWNHPERGQISPIEFIPIAEKTGLIVPLGMWVLGQASCQLKRWKETLHLSRDLYVTVNVSPVQLKQPSFANDVGRALRDSDLNAEELVLELTESGVMENPDAANRILMQLRVMGARIAIDDFGTGYSSLSRLRGFPLDYLKIDRSFVMGIETGMDARDVIQTIVKLAHLLGLRVIAEGIETPNQLAAMRALDCEYGQGFFFSRPVASEEAEELLKHGLPQMPGNDSVPAMNEEDLSCKTEVKNNLKNGAAVKHVLIAASAVILILSLGVLARFKTAHSPHQDSAVTADAAVTAKLSPANSGPVLLETAPLKIAEPLKMREEPNPTSSSPLPAAATQPTASGKTGLPPPSLPISAKKTIAAADHAFSVKHDHKLGGCKGTLKLSRDTVSFTSENGKCSFRTTTSSCSYILRNDQLTIKTASRKYRFKLENAADNRENTSQLDALAKSIFKTQSN